MDLTKYSTQIEKAIRYALQDKALELEVTLRNANVNVSVFTKFMAKLKTLGTELKKTDPEIEESLDISLADPKVNTRFTLLGKRAISEYCKRNELTGIPSRVVRIINKERVSKIDVPEYRIRFNSKREKGLSQKSPEALSLIGQLKGLDKIFRYKRRYSFFTADNLFRFDLTIVKTNTSRESRGPNTRKLKSEVRDYMRKYLVVPEYVTDRDKWLEGIKGNEFVELMGKPYTEYISKKSIKAAKVFENPMSYEIELEFLGNQLERDQRPDNATVLSGFIQNIGCILQSIDDNYFIISETEKSQFFDTYKKLVRDFKFSGPNTVDLELSNVLERDYSDYYSSVNIRKGYSVTDKADGERNLLLVNVDSKCYLMNRKNVIKATGIKMPGYENTILDGEYITVDKRGNSISLFMVFDIYFMKGEDLRERVLIRSMEDRYKTAAAEPDPKKLKSRFEYLDDLFNEYKYEHTSETSVKFRVERKKFFFGGAEPFNEETQRQITRLQGFLSTTTDEEERNSIMDRITELRDDTEIFRHCKTVLERDYIYEIDGLVFTPIDLAVGEEPNIRKRNQYSGRWHRCFKWKPHDLITIDFQISVKRNTNGKPEVKYGEYRGTMVPYQCLVLKVGYDPRQHTRYNSFRVLNEAQVYAERFSPVPFQPVNPYKRDTHILYIPVEGSSIKCENGMAINDGDIIECLYNPTAVGHFNKWRALRVRDVLTPNDFTTANNVWRTFHNPISRDAISTGIVEKTREETYYFNVNARRDMSSKSLADYHSFLKKNLIKSVSRDGGTLLDLSCGKLGDLNHWLDSNLNMCVGLDLNRDNLENVDNGAANRVLNRMLEYQNSESGEVPTLLENIMLIWADTSLNINDATAGRDILNKYYLDILKGRVPVEEVSNSKLRKFYGLSDGSPSSGFDVVSCQFSIHYFFENEKTLSTFLMNVSENLREGGKFVGTCLNGSRVFDALRGEQSIERFNNGKLLWKITKCYSNTETEFPNTRDGLAMPVDVYFESIGSTTQEYLVNMSFLEKMATRFGLRLLTLNSFGNKYPELQGLKTKYGSAAEMTPELQEYSFLNDYFIFEKDLKEPAEN